MHLTYLHNALQMSYEGSKPAGIEILLAMSSEPNGRIPTFCIVPFLTKNNLVLEEEQVMLPQS